MKGKKGWKQRACLCLMVFLIGLPGLAGASSRDDIYREELDILYTMVQSGSSYILFGEERDDLMAVWEGVRNLSPEQGLEAVKYQLLDCNGDGKPERSKRKINQCIEKASDLCYPFFISLRL